MIVIIISSTRFFISAFWTIYKIMGFKRKLKQKEINLRKEIQKIDLQYHLISIKKGFIILSETTLLSLNAQKITQKIFTV